MRIETISILNYLFPLVYLTVFLATLFTALVLTPLAGRLSYRWGLVAEPGGRRQHAGKIPKLGGVAIFAAWLVGVGLTYWLLPPTGAQDRLLLRGVLLGSGVVFVWGLLDDWLELSAMWLFGMQLVAAGIAVGHEVFIERFTNPLATTAVWDALTAVVRVEGNIVILHPVWVTLVTLLWIVALINAVNMLDGLDGLAAGVCTVAALLFAWHSYTLQQTSVPLFPLALAGALLGFLPYNFAPARIFLGGGAYLLGYQMATLSILSPAKLSTVLLVLAVPIIDVGWQIGARLRQGKSPFRGDRGHLHFRLSDRGLPTQLIVLGYYGMALTFGLVAVLASSARMKLLMLGVVTTAVLLLLFWLSRRQQMG